MGTPMFEVGDNVLVKGNCNYAADHEDIIGHVLTVTYSCEEWFDFTCGDCDTVPDKEASTIFSEDYNKVKLIKLQLPFYSFPEAHGFSHITMSKSIKKEGFIMNITKQLKDLTLSKGDRLLRKYELVDDITEDGTEVLLQMLLEDYKEALIAKVTELDKEQKAKK